jgi:putative CocE/NonD family hydrolase
LASGGAARTRAGNGLLAVEAAGGAAYDEFVYDPANPVPTRGGPICCTGNAKDRPGAVEQADVESRQDVLVYTSQPLAADLTIAGPVSAHLRVSSSALDTDIVARLVDVLPDGRALNVQEGALRLRYRAGIARPALMESGTPYDVRVDMRSIAYMFRQGHRLRLDVTSSSFPRLERNLNTGGDNAFETRMVIAKNRIHYFPPGASYLEMPVLAGGR